MENLENVLNLVFKRVSAKSVIGGTIQYNNFKIDEFKKVCLAYDERHSENEMTNMWMYYRDTFNDNKRFDGRLEEDELGIHVFEALFYYVNRMLVVQDNTVACKYNDLLHWRKMALELSEDLLISAYWAANKTPDEMLKLGFSWRTVIGHNNSQLNRIMERGIAENHFHLYGSAPIFHLTWLSLMNNVNNRNFEEKLQMYDGNRRYTNVKYSGDYEEDSLVVRYYQAAYIRAFLFSVIIGMDFENISEEEKFIFENVKDIIQDGYLIQCNLPTLQTTINTWRCTYVSMETDATILEDYALLGIKDDYYGIDEYNDVFSGERWLLYTCLNRIWQSTENREYAELFYAYIIIKENIRAELIQVNRNVGFQNFQQYQGRKHDLIDDVIYDNELVKWAVRENLFEGNIKSLEIRISPRNTAEQNVKHIKKLDDIIGEPKDKYFYTLHFIKCSDESTKDNSTYGRNYKTRKRIKEQAKALVRLREDYTETAKRILGIDAASNEIGCRPEVFGVVFRFLRNHIKLIDDGLQRIKIPQLRVTYHAGEDFLDVADGLRAIDEAIHFLNMDCGDRIGHAIALGIDVEKWYSLKGNKILIPQQDYLDNLVWIYNRIITFEIADLEPLKNFIEKQYSYYFHEIYGQFMDYSTIQRILDNATDNFNKIGIPRKFVNDRYNFDIFQYFEAWKLRGDEPELYKHGYFANEGYDTFSISDYYVNKNFPQKYGMRYVPEVFLLNYYYHFNDDVRKQGNKRIEVDIKPIYIQGVKEIQKSMRKKISRYGIGIETNPSSNYLISSFRDYEHHPIFQLYNKELVHGGYDKFDCPQLSVSINTDDLGVFSTSLSNEYALLACALEKAVDEQGKPIYDKSEIYDWVDAVRIMGVEQSFLNIKSKE